MVVERAKCIRTLIRKPGHQRMLRITTQNKTKKDRPVEPVMDTVDVTVKILVDMECAVKPILPRVEDDPVHRVSELEQTEQ
jgi:hypothetical protein